MVRNVVGTPVRGGDFFNRTTEVEMLWERLDTDNVLLLSPRRVGKTSVLYRVAQLADSKGIHAAYVSVAGAVSELELVRKLYHALDRLEPGKKLISRIAESRVGRYFERIKGVGLFGARFEIAEAAKPDWRELGLAIVSAVEAASERWLILIDELPVFVLALLRQDPETDRAREFLQWFRELRIHGPNTRWLLAGSIGLDTVTRRAGLAATINDLYLFDQLGPFSEADADELMEQLSTTYDVPLTPEVRRYVCRKIGWLLPFHLQLIFSEIRSRYRDGSPPPTEELVDQAYDELVSVAKRAYFETWLQRLHHELGPPDDQQAIVLLDAACDDPAGVTLQTLQAVLSNHIADEAARQQKLSYLLNVLQHEGYLLRERRGAGAVDHYRFCSPMIRDFWRGRLIP